MNVWLVTTGSSDVQLTSKEDWPDWWQDIKNSLYRLRFEPVRAVDDDGEPYRLPARVLGLAYEQLADELEPKLTFPLLQAFTQKLKAEDILLDQIIVLMSNQENLFPEEDRETKRCPYWQDTCQLYPILKDFFHQHFPGVDIKSLLLKPETSAKGLDDWDAVLGLVQAQIGDLDFESELDTIYISHQAGTPAISSAVQFCSLAKFGDRVKFLVSNEYNSTFPEKPLEGSSYLRGIRIQEAKALLGGGSYNYAGVEALIGDYIQENEELKALLNAAKNWNVAKFDEFLKGLADHSKFASEVVERAREGNWWWIAYEEVYLSMIRREQGNTVESFFHSFRAFEGIFASWGQSRFDQHIEVLKGIPYLNPTVLEDTESSFSKVSGKKAKKAVADIKSKLEALSQKIQDEDVKIAKDERVEMNLRTLCNLFKATRYADYDQNCPALRIFWDNDEDNNVSEKRNFIVHQVQGMTESELWSFWGVSSFEDWKNRLLEFLNFIVKEDFAGGFASLEEASLMAKVHQELERAIASL